MRGLAQGASRISAVSRCAVAAYELKGIPPLSPLWLARTSVALVT